MSDKIPGNTQRKPDCVTEVRKGTTVLTVFGYFKLDAIESAADKMARVITSSATVEGSSANIPTGEVSSFSSA